MEITAYTDHSSPATWETDRKLSGRKDRWIELSCEFSVKILSESDDVSSRRENNKPINSLYVLENKEVTDTIQKAYDKPDLFHDIAAYCCDTGKKPLRLLSTMHW